jgi:hypothetical protein
MFGERGRSPKPVRESFILRGWLLRLNPQDCHRARKTVESYDLMAARE